MKAGRALSEAADRCQQRIADLYGPGPVGGVGVLHVLALWKDPSGPPRVLPIDENAPESETDRFVLHLARARAEAIVTSGSILRAERDLTHEVGHDAEMKRELDAWRREVRGHPTPPLSLVLTRGEDLDLDHPLFAQPDRKIIYTGKDAAKALQGPAGERGVRVVGRTSPSLHDAIAWLRTEAGAESITLEVGANASRALYQKPLGVDELWLSLYEEADLDEAHRGEAFIALEELGRLLPVTSAGTVRLEASGTWRFHRFRRGPG